jgi:hypothetical protein
MIALAPRSFRIVFVCTLLLSATLGATPKLERMRALAGSCTTVRIDGCDTDTEGVLESGDCTGSSGTRIDYYTFTGQAGRIVEVMVRPLSPSFKQPVVALFSPAGDVAEPPIVGGGNASDTLSGASIIYQLSSSGTWEIAVSSDDLFASGPYVVHLYCYADDTPTEPQSCVEQYLLCGQSATWSLSADSCRFDNGVSAYALWWIYGKQNDLLQFEQESFSFTPLAGIYDQDNRLLASSTKSGNFHAQINYRVPKTGWYYFVTTTEENNEGGVFSVKLDCTGSGCTWPYLTQPVSNVAVQRGHAAIIPFTVNAIGGFTTTLLDSNEQPVSSVNTPTTSITTPPVFGAIDYTLLFQNACGDWQSNVFRVAPEASRRRSVRK